MTAADLILKKALVGSKIGSEEWSRIHAGMRDRAFIISRIEDQRIHYDVRRLVSEVTRMNLDPSEYRREIRKRLQELGYAPKPGEEGTIKDLYSKRRLDVILQQNRDQTRGFIQFKQFTTKAALEEFPASRLVRVERRKQERNWDARWRAGAERVGWEGVYRGADKVALKTSPIWIAINRFGHRYPPFDFGSGMGVENVSIDECVRMKFVKPDDSPQKVPDVGFNDGLKFEVPFDKGSHEWQELQEDFGDQIKYDKASHAIEWRSDLFAENFGGGHFDIKLGRQQPEMKAMMAKDPKLAELSKAIGNNSLTLTKENWLDVKRADGSDHRTHFFNEPNHPENIPLEKGDVDLLPSIWRKPDQIRKVQKDIFEMRIEAFDGSDFVFQVIVNSGGIPTPWSFFRTKKKMPVPRAAVPPRVANHP